MNEIEKAIFLSSVKAAVASDPSLFREVIDCATEGVKNFADNQRDIGSNIAFKLLCVLEQTPVPEDGKFGAFRTEETLDALEPCFGGTVVLARLRAKFSNESNTTPSLIRTDDDDDQDEDQDDPREREIDRHSINCYFCGQESDERDCLPADFWNGGDGGDICKKCLKSRPIPPESMAVGHELKPGRFVPLNVCVWVLDKAAAR